MFSSTRLASLPVYRGPAAAASWIGKKIYRQTFWQKFLLFATISEFVWMGFATFLHERKDWIHDEKRSKWEREVSYQGEFKCYHVNKQYYDQCRDELFDQAVRTCAQLADQMRRCRVEIAEGLPALTPAMMPLPENFRPKLHPEEYLGPIKPPVV
ncbi:hypothetical protein FOZ61_007872 [Perkinsus olseni]|uniref:Uncharacterized protein n=1 Tax=Perkinsus olseni TaxID=32597 RepID=A0A7J6L6V7_PEROL|nr:hypothetical protein FOZ61_007872 [Perkinsus olseni]KAF4657957.1 hypothetical protein FOL46_007161 [Perkinsus olseni]KAF4691912.1 hypothetical protein FOZ60_014400 [Perkinsus olseni]